MNLSEIRRYIQARTGEQSEAVLVSELNLAAIEYWPTTDPAGSIKEVYVQATADHVVALPPYVWDVKAVSYGSGDTVTLYMPRSAYTTETSVQDPLTWTKLGQAPLYRPLTGAGRITARLNGANSMPFNVTLAGPNSQGNHTVDTLAFGATDVKKEGTKAFTDLVNVGKSALTASDVTLYDVNDTQVGTILAAQTRADCQVIRIRDPRVSAVSGLVLMIYRILYKEPPITFQHGVEMSVDTTLGMALANLVSAELLSRSSNASDQGRARAYEKRATTLTANREAQRNENVDVPVVTKTNAFVNVYRGRL